MNEELRLKKVLTDGRVLAYNVWPTGWQEVVFASRCAFERAKHQVEVDHKPLRAASYASVK